MKTYHFITFLVLTSALAGLGGEIAMPDVKLLGDQVMVLDKCLFVGDTNLVYPNHIELEMGSNNNITSVVATYPRSTSLVDIKNAVSKQLGLPTKEFRKNSGGKLYEWRKESKHVTALFSEKSEKNQCPMIIISYIGKTSNSPHQP